MVTLPDHFRVLLSAIEPDEARLALAQSIPNEVREFLKSSTDIVTNAPHTRLAGSYARHTAINNIKDVDIILLIDDEYHDGTPEEALLATFSALRNLPDYLSDKGEVSVRRKQRRSVNITLENSEMSLDIVPAIASNGLSKPLDIPDREWSKWVKSDPLSYGDKLSILNQSQGEKVVPLIKLFKYWRDVHMSVRRPKSYWLECLVYQHIQSGKVQTKGKSHAEMFRDLLDAVFSAFNPCFEKGTGVPSIPDPMLGHNVAHNWERSHFETFMRNIKESQKWVSQALDPALGEEAAVELWKKVFGTEKFPTTSTVKGFLLQSALATGSVSVGRAQGRIILDKPQEPSVRVNSQRFYGEED